jgi:hypothetical protein
VAPAQQSQSLDMPPLGELRAARERPLFAPSRRPPKVQVQEQAPLPVTEDNTLPFQLTGIVLGRDYRVAILRQTGQPEELRLQTAETIAGWTIDEIGDRYVIMRGKGKRVRVWLYDESKNTGVTVNDPNAPKPDAGQDRRKDIDRDVMPSEPPKVQVPARPVPVQRPRSPAFNAAPRPPARQNPL